jgi:anthranilate/para-aminobenzoate synthase component II
LQESLLVHLEQLNEELPQPLIGMLLEYQAVKEVFRTQATQLHSVMELMLSGLVHTVEITQITDRFMVTQWHSTLVQTLLKHTPLDVQNQATKQPTTVKLT